MKNSKTNFIVKVGAFSAIAFVLQVIGSLMSIKVAGFLEVEISDLPAAGALDLLLTTGLRGACEKFASLYNDLYGLCRRACKLCG